MKNEKTLTKKQKPTAPSTSMRLTSADLEELNALTERIGENKTFAVRVAVYYLNTLDARFLAGIVAEYKAAQWVRDNPRPPLVG